MFSFFSVAQPFLEALESMDWGESTFTLSLLQGLYRLRALSTGISDLGFRFAHRTLFLPRLQPIRHQDKAQRGLQPQSSATRYAQPTIESGYFGVDPRATPSPASRAQIIRLPLLNHFLDGLAVGQFLVEHLAS